MRITLIDLYKLSLFPQLYLYFRFFRRSLIFIAGFTLIELLIAVAVMGVLATVVLVAINPIAQIEKARDADRKTGIRQIASALEQYAVLRSGYYPAEAWCDSSIGVNGTGCPVNPPQSDWDNTSSIYTSLVNGGFIKKLPKDPVNNTTYYYNYEPEGAGQGPCPAGIPGPCRYWIGARLQRPVNSANPFFRCSDNELLAAGVGCKEVSGWSR